MPEQFNEEPEIGGNAVARQPGHEVNLPPEPNGLPAFADLPEEEQQALAGRFGEIGAAAEALTAGIEEDPDEALFRAFGDDDANAAQADAFDAAEIDALPPPAPRAPVYTGPNLGGGIQVPVNPANPAGRLNAPAAAPRLNAPGAAGGRAVMAPGAPGAVAVVNPTWRPLYDLPGYMGAGRMGPGQRDMMGEAIRTLGRTIFRSMPCFRRMEEECRAARRDPLGEVQVMANIAGRGPNPQREMDAMANWIRANGMAVNAAQIEFPQVMAGYRPNIILAASEDDSFLMVEERRANGAPVDATYIYSWRGGRQTYLENPDARNALQRLGGPHAQRLQEAAPALPGAQQGQPGGPRPGNAARGPQANGAMPRPNPGGDPMADQMRRRGEAFLRGAGNAGAMARAAGMAPDQADALQRGAQAFGNAVANGQGLTEAMNAGAAARGAAPAANLGRFNVTLCYANNAQLTSPAGQPIQAADKLTAARIMRERHQAHEGQGPHNRLVQALVINEVNPVDYELITADRLGPAPNPGNRNYVDDAIAQMPNAAPRPAAPAARPAAPAAPAARPAAPAARPAAPAARPAAAPPPPVADAVAVPRGKGVHTVNADALRGLDAVPQAAAPKAAAAPRLNAMVLLRQAGFTPIGTPDGPALRKTRDDGTIAQVMGAEGKTLTLAKTFAVKILDADGQSVRNEAVVDGVDGALDWIAAQTAPGPRL